MLTAVVALMTAFMIIGGLMMGVLIGWVWKSHVDATSYEAQADMHPEMFDQYGRIIPDELIAVRFETEDDDEEEED
jgi:uncharacterized membrane protein YraQ (UPF0718 family)